MRTLRRPASVAAALAAATLAVFASVADAADNSTPRRHVVEIQKLKFVPATLEVSPGDIIVWINRDIVPHTITATDKSWDSKTIKKAGEWQMVVQADMPGSYLCRFHPVMKAQFSIVQ